MYKSKEAQSSASDPRPASILTSEGKTNEQVTKVPERVQQNRKG